MIHRSEKNIVRILIYLLILCCISTKSEKPAEAESSGKYEKIMEFSIDIPSDSSIVTSIDADGNGIILRVTSEDHYDSVSEGSIYIINEYKITEETACPAEMLKEVRYWPADLWYNGDGTWTVSAISYIDYTVRCVTFSKSGESKNSYTLELPEESFIYHHVINNEKQYIRADSSIYLLEGSSYKKLIQMDYKVDKFVMADNGIFVTYSKAAGNLYFYNSDAELVKSFTVKNRMTACDISDLGVLICDSSGDYFLTVQETFNNEATNRRPVIWQMDDNFKLLKKYFVPATFDSMIRWKRGYIGRYGADIYLMDSKFHIVDVLKQVTDSGDANGNIQMRSESSLFLGCCNTGRIMTGDTISLLDYDDSYVKNKNVLDSDKKPCEEAGGVVKIPSGMTMSEYEKQTGFDNIRWYMFRWQGEYITDGAFIGITTLNENYEEFFYFEIQDDASSGDSDSTPTPATTDVPVHVSGQNTPTGLQINTIVATEPKIQNKVSKQVQPVIKVKTKKYNKKLWMLLIYIKKYAGTDVEINFRWGNGKFQKVKLKQTNIKRNKKIFKIGYKKKNKKLYIRIRTFQKKKGKKSYSSYSKIIRIKER